MMRMMRSRSLGAPPRVISRLDDQRGSFFLWALSLNVLLLVMVLGNLPFLQTTLRATAHPAHMAGAVSLAEIGIEEGLWYLNQRLAVLVQQHSGAQAPWASPGAERADVDGNGSINLFADTLAAQSWRGWSCDAIPPTTCTRTFLGYPPEASALADNLGDLEVTVEGIGGVRPVITATGFFPSQAQPLRRRSLRAFAEERYPRFRYAAFSGAQLNLVSADTDSYDSSGAAAPTNQAHLGTNGGYSGTDVTIDADTEVNGRLDITSLTTVADGARLTDGDIANGEVLGGIHPGQPQRLPPIQFPGMAECDSTSLPPGSMISGRFTYILPQDTLTCLQSLDLNNADLVMEPGTRLYIEPPAGVPPGTVVLNIGNAGGIYMESDDIDRPNQIFVKRGAVQVRSLFGFQTPNGWLGGNNVGTPVSRQIFVADSGPGYGFSVHQYYPLSAAVYAYNTGIYSSHYDISANIGGPLAHYGSLVSNQDIRKVGPIHYDVRLNDLRLDGRGRIPTGEPRYHLKLWEELPE